MESKILSKMYFHYCGIALWEAWERDTHQCVRNCKKSGSQCRRGGICDEVINHQNETLCPRSLVVCRSSIFRPHGVIVLAFSNIFALLCNTIVLFCGFTLGLLHITHLSDHRVSLFFFFSRSLSNICSPPPSKGHCLGVSLSMTLKVPVT